MNVDKVIGKNMLMLHSSSDVYGASKIFFNTVIILKNNNYNIQVVLSEEGPLACQFRKENIKVNIIRLGILRRKYFSLPGMINRIKVLFQAEKEIHKIIKEGCIEIVYSNTIGVLIGAIVAKRCKIKHIWHIHEIIEKPILFTKLISKLIHYTDDLIIVVSEEVKKHWSKYIKGSKIMVIHNGINYAPFLTSVSTLKNEIGVHSNQILIGMIGRVNNWKGQNYFLEIAILLLAKNPALRFVLVGDPYPGYEYLQIELDNIIKKKNLKSVVINLGFRNDIPNVLKGLDIFVLPSILPDPLPTVILESMASNLPVVATKHGGALEMVDNENTGIFIPWNDANEAANKIENLIKDPNRMTKMGEEGSKRVQNLFSEEQYEEKLLKAISLLIKS